MFQFNIENSRDHIQKQTGKWEIFQPTHRTSFLAPSFRREVEMTLSRHKRAYFQMQVHKLVFQ